MTFAKIMADLESAVICDLAQYYSIYDWRRFKVEYIATLVCGLPAESRTMKALAESPYTIDQYISAIIADYLSYLLYVEIKKSTKRSVPKPKSMLEILRKNNKDENAKQEFAHYATPEAFERARQAIIEG